LWCDVDTSSVVPQALAFDRQVFDVLVRRRFHDQSRSEHATLDDLRGRGGRNDGVVHRTGHPLVHPLHNDDFRGNDV